MSRTLRWLLRVLVWAPLAALLAVLAAATTERGTAWLVAAAERVLPIEVGAVEGTLAGRLLIEGVRIDAAANRLAAARVLIDWEPWALLGGRVLVRELTVEGLAARLAPARTGPATLPEVMVPVPLRVRRLQVEVVALTREGQALTPVPIALTAEGLRAGGHTLGFARLELTTPAGQAALHGRIGLGGRHRLALEGRWRLPPREGAPGLAGSIAAQGDVGRLTVDVDVEAPLAATASVAVTDPFGGLAWEARVTVPRFGLSSLGGPSGLAAAAELTGRGDDAGGRFSLRGTVDHPAAGGWDVAAQGSLSRTGVIRLEGATAEHGDARLEARGRIALGEGPRLALTGSWQGLRWPLAGGEPALVSRAASWRAEGTVDALELSLEADTSAGGVAARWRAQATASRRGASVHALDGSLLGGRVHVEGDLDWAPAMSGRFEVEAAGLDPSRRWPQWPGRLDARAGIELARAREGLAWRVSALTAQGRLRERPVAIELAASGTGAVAGELEQARLRVGRATARASGRVGERLSLTLSADVPDLADLWPEAAGALEGTVSLGGTRTAPHLTLTARGAGARLATAGARSLRLAADVDLADPGSVALEAEATGVTAGAARVEQMRVAASGTLAAIDARVVAEGTPWSGEARLAVARTAPARWRIEPRLLAVTHRDYGRWQAAAGARIGIEPPAWEVAGLCLAQDGQRVCLEGNGERTGAWHARLQAEGIDPVPLAATLAPRLRIEGAPVSASATLSGRAFVVTEGRLEARAGAGTLIAQAADIGPQRLAFGGARLDARLSKGTLLEAQATADLDPARVPRARAELRLEAPRAGALLDPEARIDGRIELALADLGPARAVLPDVAPLDGRLESSIALAGTVGAPRWHGEAVLRVTEAGLPQAGIVLSDGLVRLSGDGERLRFEGRVHSGPGELTLTGTLQGAATAPEVRAHVRGTRFEAVRLPALWALVTPEVALEGRWPALTLSGRVTVEEALIDPLKAVAGTDAGAADVVVLGEPPPRPPRARVDADLTVVLGDRVRVVSRLARGRLVGTLRVRAERDRPPVADGIVSMVEGEVGAFGQKLKVVRGRAIFATSPLDDPTLDVEAERVAGDVTAGVRVTGTARSPQVALYSRPPLPDAEALSYLVTGRPLSALGAGEGPDLIAAALSLGLANQGAITGRIRQALGLDTLAIEGNGNGARLSLGKYLSPRLYLGFGVGLLQPQPTVKVRYDIGRGWQVETEQGVETGADVYYQIER